MFEFIRSVWRNESSADDTVVLSPSMMQDHRVSHAPTKVKTAQAPKTPAQELTPFLCERCNYHFRVNEAKVGIQCNLRCPYCGKFDRLRKDN